MTMRTITKTGSGAGQSENVSLMSYGKLVITFFFFDPNSQVIGTVVVVEEIECAVVFRINKLAFVPILGIGNVQN